MGPPDCTPVYLPEEGTPPSWAGKSDDDLSREDIEAISPLFLLVWENERRELEAAVLNQDGRIETRLQVEQTREGFIPTRAISYASSEPTYETAEPLSTLEDAKTVGGRRRWQIRYGPAKGPAAAAT